MGMGDPKDPTPYPVEPEPEGEPAADRSSRADEGARKPRIDEPGLLDEFDEDADFSSDPELEAAIAAGARPPAAKAPEAPRAELPAGPPMVKEGGVADRVWLIAAGVALLVAITEALIWKEQGRWAHVGLTVYGAVVNTGLGLAAIYLAARLLDRRLGDFERAGARVAFAACLAQAAAQLQIRLVGTRENQIEELLLAAAVYTLALWAIFRWEGRTLGAVLGLHFLAWLAIQTGASLQSCAATAAVGG